MRVLTRDDVGVNAGAAGNAISLVDGEEVGLLTAIERLIKRRIERVSAEDFVPSASAEAAHDADHRREPLPRRGSGSARQAPARKAEGSTPARKPAPATPRSSSRQGGRGEVDGNRARQTSERPEVDGNRMAQAPRREVDGNRIDNTRRPDVNGNRAAPERRTEANGNRSTAGKQQTAERGRNPAPRAALFSAKPR